VSIVILAFIRPSFVVQPSRLIVHVFILGVRVTSR
jgi:hypothetical protein